MAALLSPPAASTPAVAPFAMQDRALLQGGKGSTVLQRTLDNVYVHWIYVRQQGGDTDATDWYMPIRAKRAFKMSVRVVIRGRGRPMPYDASDDADE